MDEDLDNIIILLRTCNSQAPVSMPGAVCSVGELRIVLTEARCWRRLRRRRVKKGNQASVQQNVVPWK